MENRLKITLPEIRNKKFPVRLRGYDAAEVSNFLANLSADIENLVRQNGDLVERVVELETRVKDYASMEKAIQQTFMQAQETGGKAVENARMEAQLIIQEAELKATQILEKARAELTRLNEQVTILRAKKESIAAQLKMLLTSELDLIKVLGTNEKMENGAETEKNEDGNRSEIDDIIKNLE